MIVGSVNSYDGKSFNKIILSQERNYTRIDPIRINQNSDFDQFPGSGTADDPYLIEDYEIVNSITDLISIFGTDVFFEIKNNYLSSSNLALIDSDEIVQDGINLDGVQNGRISNNIITEGPMNGIVIGSSQNVNITDNQVFYLDGIGLASGGSSNMLIDSNYFYSNGVGGISSSSSLNVTWFGNLIQDNVGVGVNFGGFGNDYFIFNTVLNNTNSGIMLSASGIKINLNSIMANNYGIWFMRGSNQNTMECNFLSVNKNAFYIDSRGGHPNSILSNVIQDNVAEGIYIQSGSGMLIKNNDFLENNVSP